MNVYPCQNFYAQSIYLANLQAIFFACILKIFLWKEKNTQKLSAMPLKIRYIPRLTRDVIRRATPSSVLMQSILKTNNKNPINPGFVKHILSKAPNADQVLAKNESVVAAASKCETPFEETPTGFAFPMGGTQQLAFHVTRTKSGNLPVYIDYRYAKKIFTVNHNWFLTWFQTI